MQALAVQRLPDLDNKILTEISSEKLSDMQKRAAKPYHKGKYKANSKELIVCPFNYAN